MGNEPTRYTEQALMNYSVDSAVNPPLMQRASMVWNGASWVKQTGTDANVLTYTSGGTDEFLTVAVATDVSALTGTSVVVTVTWKDSNNTTATSTLTLSAAGDGTIYVPMNSKTATNVVVSTVFVGVSVAYNISAVITRFK